MYLEQYYASKNLDKVKNPERFSTMLHSQQAKY